MNTALLSALHEIENDKGIPFETVKGVLEESLLAAYEGREGANEDARVVLDEDTGDLGVMKDDEDITPHDFTRIAAQVMRQTFYQRLNEVHNEQLLEEYGERMGDIVTGIVQQAHRRMTLVDLGRVEAILPASEQGPQERYESGQRPKVRRRELRESAGGAAGRGGGRRGGGPRAARRPPGARRCTCSRSGRAAAARASPSAAATRG